MINIESISISNFRSFKEKKFSKNLKQLTSMNIFTGKNNAGKTNILRAIHLFFNPLEYDELKDMHMIKKITGGSSKHPTIEISFKDDSVLKSNYKIKCDLNKLYKKDKAIYSLSNSNTASPELKEKLKTSQKIKQFLEKNFKCVFISTTDEQLTIQADKAVNDMILQYYKRKNQNIKKSIENFETSYKEMTDILNSHISNIESELKTHFNELTDNLLDITPKIHLKDNIDIHEFITDNLEFKIDDAYSQNIENKGAGIQRATLILLNVFLLSQIYSNYNKIILLDEPEAFLYPLVIKKIKTVLETQVSNKDNNFQLFISTHSREFLGSVNKSNHSYYNVVQNKEEKSYTRSRSDFDVNKYSIIEMYTREIKNEVLQNYGLLDDIDDYEDIILCEGVTDCNYIKKLFQDTYRPQIRYGELYKDYKHIGRGANAILSILYYLDNVSDIKRKVFIILDGDDEGKKTKKDIEKANFKNIKKNIFILSNGKQIEDIMVSTSDYLRVAKLFLKNNNQNNEQELTKIFQNNTLNSTSLNTKFNDFLNLFGTGLSIGTFKYKLSNSIEDLSENSNDLKEKIYKFFNI